MIKLKPFNYAQSEEFIDIWNHIFCNKPKFTPLTTEKLTHIITKPNYIKFEDTTLLLIYLDNTLIGFFHYFLIPKILHENFFNTFSEYLKIILICNFGIIPSQRSKGIATEVIKYILNQHGQPSIIYPTIFKDDYDYIKTTTKQSCVVIFDTKNISNFWSNTLYPDEILWGHPEGIGVNENDIPTKRFVEKFSLSPLKKAVELELSFDTISHYEQEKLHHKLVAIDNLEPKLKENINKLQPFKTNYYSRTFLAVDESNKVLGYIIVSPLKLSPLREWGIYELNVCEKNKGIGSALLNEALNFIKNKGGKTLYTITIPSESGKALRFYKKFGFIEIQNWIV